MTTNLTHLQKHMQVYYLAYKRGTLTEEEYLSRIKPIDQAIDNIEMSTLQDTLVLRGSSSQLSQ